MLESAVEIYGTKAVLLIAGVLVGVLFGVTAQHSRFCLRAATVEVAEGRLGPRLSVWLIAFSAGVLCVQSSIAFGWLNVIEARQLATIGSISGALIGGALFGIGMILARGCASRLLILSSCGNLRALVTGLVLTLVAQASLRGVLSPMRETLAGIWTVPGGGARNLLEILGLSAWHAAVCAAFALALSFAWAHRNAVKVSHALSAAGVGSAVGLGWLLTYLIAQNSFDVVTISSVTFTGPSTDTLMAFVNAPDIPLGFGMGLVPGVFLGAGVTAFLSRELKIERFDQDTPMERYLVGAFLMGFGSMLAGGCAVGAGMSGGAVFSLTAWIAVLSMWAAAMITHRLIASGAPKNSNYHKA